MTPAAGAGLVSTLNTLNTVALLQTHNNSSPGRVSALRHLRNILPPPTHPALTSRREVQEALTHSPGESLLGWSRDGFSDGYPGTVLCGKAQAKLWPRQGWP